jgi:transposase-like protein
LSQSDTDKALAAEERSEETRSFVRRVRSATRRKYSPEEKIRIVLEGFRREVTVNDLCRREGIKPHSYYSCTKELVEELSLEAYRLNKTAIPMPHDATGISG